MKIHVLLFAQLREVLGHDNLDVEVPEGTVAADLGTKILMSIKDANLRALPCAYAVNETIVSPKFQIKDGDIFALIPPLSGG